jgi:hypothetical protein
MSHNKRSKAQQAKAMVWANQSVVHTTSIQRGCNHQKLAQVTCQGRRRTQKTRAVAIHMQTKTMPRMTALLAFTVVAMQASRPNGHNHMAMFEMDSEQIGVDNR